MKNNKENLSPFGIALKQFKKTALTFDKKVRPGIEYEMLKLIEEDAAKRAKFELKINLMQGIRELQRQYRHLFQDYATLSGEFSTEENPFDTILNKPDSAYNNCTNLITLLSNTTL